MANDLVNFIPEIWSKKLQKNFDPNSVFKNLVNKSYEGEIKNAGDTVHIRGYDDITVGNYTRYQTISVQDLTDPMTDLVIDQQKYFAFAVDDLDKAQMDIPVMDGYTKRSAVAMANTIDKHLHSHYADVHADNTIGSSGSPITLTKSNVYEYIVDMGKKMTDGNAPRDGRHLIINPAVEALLLKSPEFIHATDMGDKVLTKGHIGMVSNFNVHVSTNLNVVSTNTPLLALTNDLITFAMQYSKVMPFEPSKEFTQGVKGLALYGSKVLDKHTKQGAVLWVDNE